MRQLRRFRRAFLPAYIRADIRDYDLIVALMERNLAADSDCLDVGAHQGLFLAHMVRLAPRGRHVAWEPLPAYADELARRFPAVDVHRSALAPQEGEAGFQVALDDPGWSGLHARPTPHSTRFETITVRTERLDDVLPADVNPKFLKMNVEGGEEGVLRGGLDSLRRHRPLIVFEHAPDAAGPYGTTTAGLHELLRDELGYSISGLDGGGPYEREEFVRVALAGERYNFLARPT